MLPPDDFGRRARADPAANTGSGPVLKYIGVLPKQPWRWLSFGGYSHGKTAPCQRASSLVSGKRTLLHETNHSCAQISAQMAGSSLELPEIRPEPIGLLFVFADAPA